ncbi:hypothetical protein A7P54_12335 [Acinetobacter sp. Ac_3412]|uniref:fused MFS/spermidine synthase n=1 Tax=Acinetobacter sp. Ac_3412 TaxID=1848935 RepID=UPI001C09CD8E|nr:fused MFS/spermidine synthase [Acinetobacter sp. Ac_3412]NNP77200.1 hypothetical protein [Acinetobacter sp. Ac_3412]
MKNNKIIYLISFFSGFLSLGQEIIWMRLISFAGMSVPQTFSYTLAIFLVGISVGAQIGKLICKNNNNVKVHVLGYVFFIAAIVDIFLIACVYFFSHFIGISILFFGLCVFICAAVRGIIFPLVHHVGTVQEKTGAQISNVYFSNVFGSALAPLIIGFIALDYLNTQQVYLIICFMTFVVAILCLNSKNIKGLIAVLSFLTLFMVLIPEHIFYELSKNSYDENKYPSHILENKHGFIQVYDEGDDHIVFGANVYDGKFNTNIFHNTNGIDRAYLLTTIKPDAKNVLVIGLSTGSWVKVLTTMPNVEKITVIEINPAYVELIKISPIVSDILKDKRVEIIFDDGRKWLKKNQEQKFDIVLMNTTWHWRAYVSNLLSYDFLKIINGSLGKGGVLFYNTTQSLDAYYTAKKVFPYVYKYKYFVLASNQKQSIRLDSIQSNLCDLKDYFTKVPVFSSEKKCLDAAKIIIENPFLSYSEINFSQLNRSPEVITDNNMLSEYKYGKGL